MRAVAVILVILVHASVPGFEGGYIGVDVFFVISGFVITQLLLRQPEGGLGRNLARFYSRRIRRIVPAATLVLVVTAVAGYVVLGHATGNILVVDVRWASLFAANFRLIVSGPGYFVAGVPPSLVTQFWSLAVEEQFYIVYPLIVFGLGLLVGRRRPTALALVLITSIAVSSYWSIYLTSANQAEAYYSPFTRFWELALGGLVALIPSVWAKRTERLHAVVGWVALAVVLVAAVRLNGNSAYPGSLAWWPCGATALLLYTGQTASVGSPVGLLNLRPVRYIGDISYSLYLWHFIWIQLPLQAAHGTISDTTRVLQVLGAAVCAVASYHLLENPIRRSKLLEGDTVAAVLVLVVCVLVTWNVTYMLGVW
jgi:peptidoglycan/LPS O-acetylase OafA/YrhL